jgi:hypothetical protein
MTPSWAYRPRADLAGRCLLLGIVIPLLSCGKDEASDCGPVGCKQPAEGQTAAAIAANSVPTDAGGMAKPSSPTPVTQPPATAPKAGNRAGAAKPPAIDAGMASTARNVVARPQCPDTEPEAGMPCDLPAYVPCAFGETSDCRWLWTCDAATRTWILAEPWASRKQRCATDAEGAGCPSAAEPRGFCDASLTGGICVYDDGTTCSCLEGVGPCLTLCGGLLERADLRAWFCSPAFPCPTGVPRAGSTCGPEGLRCQYPGTFCGTDETDVMWLSTTSAVCRETGWSVTEPAPNCGPGAESVP